MSDLFSYVAIKECAICKKKDCYGVYEGVSEYDFGHSHSNVEFCEECFEKNTYENEHGFVFLKFKDKLFCHKPYQYMDFGFRQVMHQSEIDKAFNPDFYRFNEWLSNY